MIDGAERAKWGEFPIGGSAALGATLRSIRVHTTPYTQAQLAGRARLYRRRVGALERAESTNPGLMAVARVAHGLDVSVAVFVAAFIWPTSCDLPFERWADDAIGGRSRSLAKVLTPPPSVVGPTALGLTLQGFRSWNRRATLRGLASSVGMSTNSIVRLEQGAVANPGLATIARLAHALNDNLVDLGLLDLSVSLLAQVYAGEISVHKAVSRRQAWDAPRPVAETERAR